MKKSEVCFLFLLSLFCFACSDSADKEEMEFPEGIKEQMNTITNRYNKWLYLFHISSC